MGLEMAAPIDHSHSHDHEHHHTTIDERVAAVHAAADAAAAAALHQLALVPPSAPPPSPPPPPPKAPPPAPVVVSAPAATPAPVAVTTKAPAPVVDSVEELKVFMVKAAKKLRAVISGSSTVVRLDLQRPGFVRETFRAAESKENYNGWGQGPAGAEAPARRRHNFRVEQTRLKLMQKWDTGSFLQKAVGDAAAGCKLDFGMGLDVSLLEARVIPELRLRLKLNNEVSSPNIYLRALPRLELVARGRVPISDTGIFLGLRLQLPLRGYGAGAEGGGNRRGPMLMAQLTQKAGTGAHISTRGVDFDEKHYSIGPDITFHTAASVDFPREYPLAEGEGPLKLTIKKMGVKKVFHWDDYKEEH